MHRTRHDLPEKTRRRVVELLQPRLAEALDLALQTKQAHWNVKGAQFAPLHALFDQIYGHVVEHGDEIAERIVQLGGQAAGTLQVVATTSGLPAFPLDTTAGGELVDLVAASLSAFGREVRAAIDATMETGDADTADLLTGVSRQCDKDLWMLEAHLQG